MSNTDKYLHQYAESEVNFLEDFPPHFSYENSIVIPAYNESHQFISNFINSKLSNEKVLLIVVINQPVNNSNVEIQIQLDRKICSFGKLQWQYKNLSLIELSEVCADILVVDRYNGSNKIPDKQGVGLARKIGADIATALIKKSIIKSNWICSTDADAHLPNNYFSVLINLPKKTSAAIYQFRHIDNNNPLSKATQLYEKALRYYVSGLKWAGSKYAFHTIGSTLAFRNDYYSQVRGFPKRAAGEDFYLLNKLAKLSDIKTFDDAIINIEPRLSDRVPFGTGPAVAKILALENLEDYHYYHPQLFSELKNCLQAFESLWDNRNNFQSWYSALSDPTQFGLEKLRFNRLVEHLLSQNADKNQTRLQIDQWFDAFRTLKFIHYLQENRYPPIPLEKALNIQQFDLTLVGRL